MSRQKHSPKNSKLHKLPRTVAQYDASDARLQDALRRLTNLIGTMRGERISLKKAAKINHIRPATVIRLAGSNFRKQSNGRYAVKPGDQLLRILQIPTPQGTREIGVRGSRQASTVGTYWASVHKFLRTGDSTGLARFRVKQIRDSSGAIVRLITDLTELKRLGSAGVLRFESLYSRTV